MSRTEEEREVVRVRLTMEIHSKRKVFDVLRCVEDALHQIADPRNDIGIIVRRLAIAKGVRRE